MVTDSVLFFSAPSMQLVDANLAASLHLGYSQQKLRRMSLLDIVSDSTRESLIDSIESAVLNNWNEARVHTAYRHQNGALLPVVCSVRILREGPSTLLVAVARESDSRSKESEERFDVVIRDHLTGLPTREWFLQQLERDVQRAQNSNYRFAVLFVDVDRFKAVNDSFGHLAGDQALQAVANRLTASVRPGDVVARYGGDEFVVLLGDMGCARSVGGIAQRIGQSVLTAGTLCGGQEWVTSVTVSVGAAICDGRSSSATHAIERADRAMYQAKTLGRNGQFVIDELSSAVANSDTLRDAVNQY